MLTPQFSNKQYVSPGILNTAYGTVSGDQALLATLARRPGLVGADRVGLTTGAGLAVTGTFPSPFGIVFSGGPFAQAHGVNTNQDTQTYIIDFTPIVTSLSGTGSGNVTAYIAATFTTIQQNPYTVTGPPPGHPDYNPNFTAYTAYATQVDTLSISAVSGAVPDNLNTFEIARATVNSGSTGVAVTTEFQVRAATHNIWPIVAVSGTLTPAQAGQVLYLTGPATLPASQACQGLIFAFTNSSSGTAQTVFTSGSDLIFGFGPNPASGLASTTVYPAAGFSIVAGQPGWQVLEGVTRGTSSVYNAPLSAGGTPLYSPFLAAISGTTAVAGNIPVFIGDSSGTIKDSGISSGSAFGIRAWCAFDLSTGAIVGTSSSNVASVTPSAATGAYTVNTTGVVLTAGGTISINSLSAIVGPSGLPQPAGGPEVAAGTNPACKVWIYQLNGSPATLGIANFVLIGA